MLVTMDVGNTNTVLGVYRGSELVANWRLTTARDQTVDEYGILTRNLFSLAGLDAAEVNGLIISSVVPPLNRTLAEMAERYFRCEVLFVEPGVRTGMPVLYDSPQDVGADRIVNAVAAYEKYGGPCIVVDFGTAITFDAISGRGEYIGGTIVPGLGIASEALFSRAARLQRVEIKDPGMVIGISTSDLDPGGTVLRLPGPDGWTAGAHEGGTRAENPRRGHRGPGTVARRFLQAGGCHRRFPYTRRPAPHLGTQSRRGGRAPRACGVAQGEAVGRIAKHRLSGSEAAAPDAASDGGLKPAATQPSPCRPPGTSG